MQSLPKIQPLFPQYLKKKNDDEKFKKLLYVFNSLVINLLFIEALMDISVYAKFMKELVTKEMILDF